MAALFASGAEICAVSVGPASGVPAAIPAALFALMTRKELLEYELLGKKLLKNKKELEQSIVGSHSAEWRWVGMMA